MGERSRRFESATNAVIAICAIVFTVILLRREFGRPSSVADAASQEAVFVRDWEQLLLRGRQVGSASASLKVIEFIDYECGFCRSFAQTLEQLSSKFESQVAVSYVNYPLRPHRFARMSAAAVECAHPSGRFSEMQALLFAKQDSFGLKPWSRFAIDASISDTTAFLACMSDSTVAKRISDDVATGERVGVLGTPTVIVNGWRLASPPSIDELERIAAVLVAGGRWKPQLTGDSVFALSGSIPSASK
jgi:thiol-disulfide isomerase/thioredoxin